MFSQCSCSDFKNPGNNTSSVIRELRASRLLLEVPACRKEKKRPHRSFFGAQTCILISLLPLEKKKRKKKKKTRVRRGGVSRGRLSRVFHPPAQAHRPPHHVSVYLGRVFKASEHSVGYVSRGWRLLFHRPPKHEAEEPCERQPLETRGGGESFSACVDTTTVKRSTQRGLCCCQRDEQGWRRAQHTLEGEKKKTHAGTEELMEVWVQPGANLRLSSPTRRLTFRPAADHTAPCYWCWLSGKKQAIYTERVVMATQRYPR